MFVSPAPPTIATIFYTWLTTTRLTTPSSLKNNLPLTPIINNGPNQEVKVLQELRVHQLEASARLQVRKGGRATLVIVCQVFRMKDEDRILIRDTPLFVFVVNSTLSDTSKLLSNSDLERVSVFSFHLISNTSLFPRGLEPKTSLILFGFFFFWGKIARIKTEAEKVHPSRFADFSSPLSHS